jgi:hypothetical protein
VSARRSVGSGVLRLQLKGTKLKNVEGIFSKSDPFFEISLRLDAAGGQTWDNVYRSEEVHNNLNPEWKEVVIDLSVLCGGNLDLPLKIAVFDHESSGKHTSMGDLHTTVNGLKAACHSKDELRLKKGGKYVGTISILKASVDGVEDVTQKMAATSVSSAPAGRAPAYAPTPSAAPAFAPAPQGGANFVDYMAGGCQLNVAVAIDFTGSNGDPRKPGTLHHLSGPGVRNDYERAIAAIVSILAKYDSDQMFPVYGFGAKYGGTVRHCFQCGGKSEHHGVAGVLDAYHQTFKSGLTMSGPTVFTEVIKTTAARAQSAQQAAMQSGSQCYTILLILTDGEVSDVQATARALEQASGAPLSVVIVGVGDADFSSMQFLDDCSGPGKRDIAQFVELNMHSHNSQALTSETLHEIPDQLAAYFQSLGIAPRQVVLRSDSQISVEEEEEIDLTLNFGEEEIVVTGGGDDFVDGFKAGQ